LGIDYKQGESAAVLSLSIRKYFLCAFAVRLQHGDGARTCNELRGMSCLTLEEVAPPKKQIVSSRSFGVVLTTYCELREAVTTYMPRLFTSHKSTPCLAFVDMALNFA
jgi:hypothetical protein